MTHTKRTWIVLSSMALIGGGLVAFSTAQPEAGAPVAYQVDPVHSSVVFAVRHHGVGNVYGMFHQVTGTMSLDFDNPTNSSFDITVDATSIDTGNDRRDKHLASADFFKLDQFTKIHFRSTKVSMAGDQMKLKGDLTMLGVTRPIEAQVFLIGAGQHPSADKPRAGVEAWFTLQRSAFGMTWGIENDAVGDKVKLIVALEGIAG
jgi:polyisoprenoid-binding protein YceI